MASRASNARVGLAAQTRLRPEVRRTPAIRRVPLAAFPATVPLSVHSNASRPRATRLTDAAAALNELPSNATTLRPVASKTSLPQRSVVSKRTAIWLPRGCKEMPTVGS